MILTSFKKWVIKIVADVAIKGTLLASFRDAGRDVADDPCWHRIVSSD